MLTPTEKVAAVADTLAEHQRADEARDTGVDVHDGAAGEVERAHLLDVSGVGDDFGELRGGRLPGGIIRGGRERFRGGINRVGAGPVPDHVRDREVDEGDPERDEQHHRRELHALGERADD